MSPTMASCQPLLGTGVLKGEHLVILLTNLNSYNVPMGWRSAMKAAKNKLGLSDNTGSID